MVRASLAGVRRRASVPWPMSTTSPPGPRKSVSAGVDIERWCGYGFSRSPERQQGPAETNCRAGVPQLQFAGRCGGGVPKPGLLQDGDGADGRTGWPAVIRGRREQYRSSRSNEYPQVQYAVKSVSSTSVKASAADARTGRFGSGVLSQSICRTGDGAGCRKVALYRSQSSTQESSTSSR